MSVHDANLFARAWLSVDLASAKDADRPVFDHTICVEVHPEGVRLVATDSYMLLSAWVPSIDVPEPAADPGLDAAPISVAVARDSYGRARSLCQHLVSLTSGDDKPEEEVRLSFGADTGRKAAQLDGFDSTYFSIDHPDHERVQLALYEGAYPNWRRVVSEFRGVRTDVVALNPDLVGRLAKLGKLHTGAALRWRFGGIDKAAHVSVETDDLTISGLVMPLKVEWDELDRAEAA